MDQRSKTKQNKTKHCKTLKRKCVGKSLDFGLGNTFLDMTLTA